MKFSRFTASLRKVTHAKRKGAGGLFFIFTAMLAIQTMLWIVSFSRISTAMSISDNIAHIISTNVSVVSYQSGKQSFTLSGGDGIKRANGTFYYPLQEFNKIATGYGFTDSGASDCLVTWDASSKVATVQIGSFKTEWDSTIRPHQQNTVIESN